MEFQERYLALFLLFLVIDGFGWFWMKNLSKKIQLMLEFLKGPTLFLLYINDLPVRILFLILLSMLIILLSTLSVIKHLICDNK